VKGCDRPIYPALKRSRVLWRGIGQGVHLVKVFLPFVGTDNDISIQTTGIERAALVIVLPLSFKIACGIPPVRTRTLVQSAPAVATRISPPDPLLTTSLHDTLVYFFDPF